MILSNQRFNWLDLVPNQWEIDKVKDHFIIQRFVTYTSLGNNLAILCSFYSLIFNNKTFDVLLISSS